MTTAAATLLLALALWAAGARPAGAACHIAAFDQASVSVAEEVGTVTLTVFLQGRQPSCEGTVDYETVHGTATDGEDFTPASGTLEFVADDDREETIEIEILADDVDEGDEEFTVLLTNPTGGISGTSDAATVTITDAGGEGGAASEPAAVETDPATESEPDIDATVAAEDPDEGSSAGLMVVFVILGVIALVTVTMLARRGRSG